jgi:hypothetical protein
MIDQKAASGHHKHLILKIDYRPSADDGRRSTTRSSRHARGVSYYSERLTGFLAGQPMLLVLLERFLKARHKNLPWHRRLPNLALRTGEGHGGRLTRYKRRTNDPLPTLSLGALAGPETKDADLHQGSLAKGT